MEQDLWGPVSSKSGTAPVECKFEDSFVPNHLQAAPGKECLVDEDEYIPLDDSSQYLAGLEKKLARIQGRSANRRQTESRRLIDALAGSRETHAHQLINTTSNHVDENIPVEHELIAHQNTAVDPQGTFGMMLRKLAPDKVALTHEELCQLLEADFLAKVQEAAEEEARETENQLNLVNNSQNTKVDSDHQNEPPNICEDKKHSSDEGEK